LVTKPDANKVSSTRSQPVPPLKHPSMVQVQPSKPNSSSVIKPDTKSDQGPIVGRGVPQKDAPPKDTPPVDNAQKVLSLDEKEESEVKIHDFVTEPNIFLVTKTARFGVEKKVLAKFSFVFKTTVEGDPEAEEIPINDFEDDVILEVMKYMYTPAWAGEFKPSDDDYYESMIRFAYCYEIALLSALCEKKLIELYNMSIYYLRFADAHHLEDMKAAAIGHIAVQREPLNDDDLNTLYECSKTTLTRLIRVQKTVFIQAMTGKRKA
jgi:hypothetical protein